MSFILGNIIFINSPLIFSFDLFAFLFYKCRPTSTLPLQFISPLAATPLLSLASLYFFSFSRFLLRWLQAPARISPAAGMVVVCRRTAIAQLARRPVVLVVGGRYCAELGERSSLHMAQYSRKDWIWATSTFLRSIPPCFAVALAAQVLLSISLRQQMWRLTTRWYFSLDLIFSLCFLFFCIIPY